MIKLDWLAVLLGKQAEKLKSCQMKEGRMMKDEGWIMMISSCLRVLVYDRQTNEQMDRRTDICECRVAFATEKQTRNKNTVDALHTLKLCMTFVHIIRTSKHFWLLQWIWPQTKVTFSATETIVHGHRGQSSCDHIFTMVSVAENGNMYFMGMWP